MELTAGRTRRRGGPIALLVAAVLAIGLIVVPAALASPVIVQGTTDIRDAGLLEDVIEPGFRAAYPQYELKYIAVGTGAAIKAAKAGQGDALVVHAPSQEKTFVEEGYSLEPRGRAIFYSDYVVPGPLNDPAEVLAKAHHNAALAYELIAKAGEEGKANFVSRGDGSGTNTQELAIWKLTKVELNEVGEPGPKGTKNDAPWYHKAGAPLGQAETLKLASECPFTGGGCYEMTDRGTYNRSVGKGSVTNLQIVTEKNEPSAPGGSNLLTNPFSTYVVNPAKVGVSTNVEGAEAFAAYLTSEEFQARLANYPSATSPAFFADAHPALTATTVSGTLASGTPFAVNGTITSLLPGASPVAGVQVNLQEAPIPAAGASPAYATIASGVTGADGSYSLGSSATKEGLLRVEMPTTTTTYPDLTVSPLIAAGALTQTFADAGRVTLPATSSPSKPPITTPIGKGRIVLRGPSIKGRVVTLRGSLGPAVSSADSAVLVVQARRLHKGSTFHGLKQVRARDGVAYKLSVKLGPGRWKLRVRYRDPGVIAAPADSRAVSVTVR